MDRNTDNASRALEFNSDTVEYPEVVQQGWGQNLYHAAHSVDDGAWKGSQQHNLTSAEMQEKVSDAAEQRERGHRIARMPVWAFWLLLGALGLVVIGASVGGAVGGSAAVRSHDSSNDLNTSGTSSIPSASSANPSSSIGSTSSISSTAPSASATASTDCPGVNGTAYTPAGFSGPISPGTYTQVCGGNDTKPRWVQSNGQLTSAFVSSLKPCIDLCSYWNLLASDQTTLCAVAALIPDGRPPYNCWIRNTWNNSDDFEDRYLALGFLNS
ncbi:hypothetical protein M409DRAFT_20893 [Zasmidium cellare ATCC 36951]|uniref:Apple domain-containing protein n=1 Tax=Zasmidium cellare ATCC 36951 TaxID=1080233 RepID=A0A6A6CSX4_ZASCE|nr:uncharacterized protein M409DRAFT_20893 [Zasmidium cellare ATCC 36951]KAF2168879.1 hypothetical protein M409DRAFT_20893 [Zasmidium cellare ATCC 36951]